MRLKKIELKNFKRLADFHAEFSPGINVVKGPLNEMGKSTLLEGIIVALFHNPKSTAKELKAYASWGSTGQFRTSLEFEEKGNRYLLEKDFDKGSTRLICDNTREEIDTFKEVSQRIADLLGTKSDDLFLCSSCIRQSEVSAISSGKKQITESLEEVVMGGKESTFAWQVVQKLDSKVAEMKKGLDKLASNPGVLASLRSKIQATSQRYGEVKEEVSRTEAKRIELVEVSKQLAEVKEQYENARALLDKNRQRKEIEASIQTLTKDYDGVEKLLGNVKTLREDSEKADKALSAEEGFGDKRELSELRRELDAIQSRRGIIEKDLAEREEELAEAKGKLGRRKSVAFLGSAKGIAAATAILAGGIVGVIVGPPYFLSLIILGAALLVITMRARNTLIRDETRDATGISGVERRIQDMMKAVGALSRNEQELLAKAKCSTVAEFNEKERDLRDWLDKKNAAELQLKAMVGGKTVQEIEEEKLQLARKLATEEAKLTDDLKQTFLNPEKYVALERKVRDLETRQAELERQKSRCEIIIEQARFNIEDQIRLEEELEALQDSLRHEDKKVRVYRLASEFLSRARTDVLSSVEGALEKEIQKYLAIFTNDKYKQVKVNKEALDFWVYSDEKGDWVRPEELSGGAIDEFYLAFRLALVKLIFGDKKPPLILDDPFVNFDSVRLNKTLEFLKTLASDYQIIIFTLGDSYDKVADNIILLTDKEKPAVV
jgi:DNA repair exonuclease SbcCD ATPase subunit